jgi:hypothetical protein
MKTVETNSKERENHKSAKKRQQSSTPIDIGSPKVPIKQRKTTNKPQESLNDWSDAS